MRNPVRGILHMLDSKFGRCLKCLRVACRAALLAWLAMVVLSNFPEAAGLANPAMLLAAGLTILAVLHVVFFAARQVKPVKSGQSEVFEFPPALRPGRSDCNLEPGNLADRRQILQLFLKGCATAAFAVLVLPRPARAACGDCAEQFGSGYHDCITNFCGTQGQVCCPPGFPYLNHCDCQCYETTNFNCNSYSNCLYCS